MDFRNEPVRQVPKYREKRPNRKKKKLEDIRGSDDTDVNE